VLHGDLEAAFAHFWQDTRDRYRLVQGDPERPVLPPTALFLSAEQFYARANDYAQLALRPALADGTVAEAYQNTWAGLPPLTVVRGAEDPMARLKQHLQTSAHRVLVLAESEGRRESLLDFLRASALDPVRFDSLQEFIGSEEKIGLATAPLMNGFSWLEHGIDFVTETELFASGPVTRKRRKQEQVSDVEALIKDLSELNVGDPVVHSAHGVGRYRGLVNLDLGQKDDAGEPVVQEFLHLEYAGPPCTCRSASCS
jgi:transcription-repair coupling factor (superfamily II helicase)